MVRHGEEEERFIVLSEKVRSAYMYMHFHGAFITTRTGI